MAMAESKGSDSVPEEKLRQWEKEQADVRSRISVSDDFSDWDGSTLAGLHTIGGIDISFYPNSSNAIAALSILQFPSLEHVQTVAVEVTLTEPYVPYYLAFREMSHMLALLETSRQAFPELMPQVLLLDGNGVYHPRRCGSASHFGVLADVPTIGVAKKILVLPGSEKSRDVMQKEIRSVLTSHEDSTPLHDVDGTVLGMAVVPSKNSQLPVYVSCGHRISLQSAVKVVTNCSQYQEPEPIRVADLASRMIVRQNGSGRPFEQAKSLPVPEERARRNIIVPVADKKCKVLYCRKE